jgi:hypothetical protein
MNEPIKKWATELNRTFSKEEIQMAKKTPEKMLTISSHKGSTNQNHTKIPPHPCYNSHDPKHHHQQVLARMFKRTLVHCLRMQAGTTPVEDNMEAS